MGSWVLTRIDHWRSVVWVTTPRSDLKPCLLFTSLNRELCQICGCVLWFNFGRTSLKIWSVNAGGLIQQYAWYMILSMINSSLQLVLNGSIPGPNTYIRRFVFLHCTMHARVMNIHILTAGYIVWIDTSSCGLKWWETVSSSTQILCLMIWRMHESEQWEKGPHKIPLTRT